MCEECEPKTKSLNWWYDNQFDQIMTFKKE